MSIFAGFFDDAAVFPPGSKPLPQAVPDHLGHRSAGYGDLVGPLVLAAPALADLGQLVREPVAISVTAPGGPAQVADALARAADLPVHVTGLEVAVPADSSVPEFFAALERVDDVPVFVEVPRDARRAEVIATCAKTGHHAKFRTGGVKAELYPDEAELAAAIVAVVVAGVPFKATAGLHHALRNTDPETGFEQHGFLNLLTATAAARDGASEADLAGLLADRDGAVVARRVSEMDAGARESFRSFGTCSIIEPVTEVVGLGLVPASVLGEGEKA
ncbi:hypothetical protein [Amycolatopsis sp. CA-230715]|uniref:hypothetical protein n=1 Tax=Amycolatopsis sp. CA-230715 TaxID=2745196 RepID=UPI001C01A696|nr:hypothetical protein [Amycolatopsis sp. CA-230715]QWF84907.1 hypothetical protein HUW46_08359 [Amycolatopsis sp. CA-230715]